MAHATEVQNGFAGVNGTVAGIIDTIKAKLAARAVYTNTVNELNTLNDRELADLGISRSSIRYLARMAAYGK